jgi:hypothetical protein
MRQRHYFSTHEKKWMLENAALFTRKDLSEILDCSPATVHRVLTEANVLAVKKRYYKTPLLMKQHYVSEFQAYRLKRIEQANQRNATLAGLKKRRKTSKKPKFQQLEIPFKRKQGAQQLYIKNIPNIIRVHWGILPGLRHNL